MVQFNVFDGSSGDSSTNSAGEENVSGSQKKFQNIRTNKAQGSPLQVETFLDMLDAPLVEMLKVMIICNKAKVNIGCDNEKKQLTGVEGRKSSNFAIVPTVVSPHGDLKNGLAKEVDPENGPRNDQHYLRRSFRARATSFCMTEDKITITGNPSETALLRYCSRITSVLRF